MFLQTYRYSLSTSIDRQQKKGIIEVKFALSHRMIRAIILSMLPVVVFGAAVGYNKRICYDVLIPECQGV